LLQVLLSDCQCCPGVWNYEFLMQQKWPASISL
jgi:hypothetical protein